MCNTAVFWDEFIINEVMHDIIFVLDDSHFEHAALVQSSKVFTNHGLDFLWLCVHVGPENHT